MDFLDAIINFFNVTDNSNLVKIYFEKFTDNNEYIGERILSFILFIILIFCYIALVFGILFLIYKFFKQL